MTRLLAVAACAALATAAVPSTAAGQSSSIAIGGPAGTQTTLPLRATGQITVDFHGDPAAGCASFGLCGIQGAVTWSPGPIGSLDLFESRSHRVRATTAVVSFGEGFPSNGPATRAEVDRSLPAGGVSTCTDLHSNLLPSVSGTSVGRRVTLSFADRSLDLVGSRCAGPLDSDVLHALPATSSSAPRLRHGRQTLSFAGLRAFSSHGLTGSVTSTLRLHTGRPVAHHVELDPITRETPADTTASLEYRVVRVSGQVPVTFSGVRDDSLCSLLDTCGLSGTISLSPSARKGEAGVIAYGTRRVSRHDLRVALGLARGRPRRGISVYGYALWTPHDSTATATATREDGSPPCHDTARLTANYVTLIARRGRLLAGYAGSPEYGGDPLRTRCPGPDLGDVSHGGALASGSIPLAALRHRTVVLHLTGQTYGAGSAYQGSLTPNVTIVLQRAHLRPHRGGGEFVVLAGHPKLAVR